MTPQSGHVSNFCCPTGIVIEPIDPVRFQEDRRGTPVIVHDRPPAWTRLELAKGTRDSRDPPGAAVSEQPLRWDGDEASK
jgi:hypothetical protein